MPKHLKPLILLCGARNSSRRNDLNRYFKQHHATEVIVFYAEDVWEHVRTFQDIDALQMETQLGQFADILIVIVESAGTFTELGAFAAREELRHKLFPILDRKYQAMDSFINVGPVSWVNRESKYGPSLFCNFDTVLLTANQVVERTNRVPRLGRPQRSGSTDLSKNPKRLLFLLADLIAVVGPVTRDTCQLLLGHIVDAIPIWDVHSLLGLLKTIGFVKTFKLGDDIYYIRPLVNGQIASFYPANYLAFADVRIKFLSDLQAIPEGRAVLIKMHETLSTETHGAA